MSIWASDLTLHRDGPLGAPYEVDWPGQAPRTDNGFVDVAHVAGQGDEGWIRLIVAEAFDKGDETVMLSPEQATGTLSRLAPYGFAGCRRVTTRLETIDDPVRMTESLPETIRRLQAQRWEVAIEQVGNSAHVYPVRGVMTVAGPDRYPRTDRGVRRAVRLVQRWCDSENAKLDKGAALLSRHHGGSNGTS